MPSESTSSQFPDLKGQQAVRNVPAAFLPYDKNNPLGYRYLHCALITWLQDHKTEAATGEHWRHRIANLSKKGLRQEEISVSGLEEVIANSNGRRLTGDELIKGLTYDGLRLRILHMLRYSDTHVRFISASSEHSAKRIKPKLKRQPPLRSLLRDPVLGYWIDVAEWDDLLGRQRGWIAFTHRGQPLTSVGSPLGLCASPEEAMKLANSHAKKMMPKLSLDHNWAAYRLTGGAEYREWLVTLPDHKQNFYSEHFEHRNILMHLRCDVREDVDSNRILVLQEVQSDWAQNARRELKEHAGVSQGAVIPPWLSEWPSLALKLALLHAVHLGVAGLAWTSGEVQVDRWERLGEKGLLQLYDHTLPKELNRLLRSYGQECEEVDVYLPTNFRLDPCEDGYAVSDEDDNLLGIAPTWREVESLLPDGAHEQLTPMWGVKLDQEIRVRILKDGVFAWGNGIQDG
jgi:hypothetical protein